METNNEKLNAIQAKLRKLQKMYEGAKSINSEGEAAAAAAAIQRILTEYNLTMDEIGVEPEKNAVIHTEESGFTFRSIGGQWQQKLYSVLCKYNFCRCFMYGGTYKRLLLVGTEANLEVVKWMEDVLSRKYVELSVSSWKEFIKTEEYARQNPKMSKDRYQRNFLLGCCSGLSDKLYAERKQDEEDAEIGSKVNALVLRHNAAIEEYVGNTWGKTRTSHRSESNFYSARHAGYQAGRNTNVGRPISGARQAAENFKSLGC